MCTYSLCIHMHILVFVFELIEFWFLGHFLTEFFLMWLGFFNPSLGALPFTCWPTYHSANTSKKWSGIFTKSLKLGLSPLPCATPPLSGTKPYVPFPPFTDLASHFQCLIRPLISNQSCKWEFSARVIIICQHHFIQSIPSAAVAIPNTFVLTIIKPPLTNGTDWRMMMKFQ